MDKSGGAGEIEAILGLNGRDAERIALYRDGSAKACEGSDAIEFGQAAGKEPPGIEGKRRADEERQTCESRQDARPTTEIREEASHEEDSNEERHESWGEPGA
jgi:hypothetical protein